MLNRTISLALACAALLLNLPARAAGTCTDLHPGTNHVTITSEGGKQSFDVVLPASHDPAKRVPLVIGLHPSGGTGSTFDQDSGLGAAATSKGFAAMFPDGGIRQAGANGAADGHFWNIPGVPLVNGDAVPAGTRDDVRFIADAIDHLVKNNCVDPRRVYATGFSGGARMSSMLGCRLADRLAAVAPVGGLRAGRAAGPEFAEPDPADCKPAKPIAVLAVHGTDDQTNPFPGGGGLRWGYSVEQAAARWASLDHCGTTPALTKISEHVVRESYGTCATGGEVVLYRIEAARDQGGGHVWAGGVRDLSTRAQKPQAAELAATAVILDFFARH